MKKTILCLLLSIPFLVQAQETFIPDDNFELYIETHDINGGTVPVGDPESMGNGIVGDNLVSTVKIGNAIEIYMEDEGVTDLTGINEFTSLYQLYIYDNNISTLEINIPSLWTIGCSGNAMTSLDITGCTGLANLVSNNNLLETLDFTTNIELDEVYLNDNIITGSLDFRNSPNITYLEVKNNLLERIDLRNRGSASIPFEFNATQNPNLSCVLVDDINAIPNGWVVDNIEVYTENEEDCIVLGLVDRELHKNISVYPNPSTGLFKITSTQSILSIEVVDLSGKVVAQFEASEQYAIHSLQKGLYILKITTSTGLFTEKLILTN